MLRARAHAWQDRARPFVCAACRQRLSPPASGHHPDRGAASASAVAAAFTTATPASAAAGALAATLQRTPPPRIWGGVRPLSTTARCYSDSDSSHRPGSGPAGPGPFPGAFSRPAGAWGTFAATASGRSQNGPLNDDGLLPHEREARSRSTTAQAPAPPKDLQQAQKTPLRPHDGHRRNNHTRNHQGRHLKGQGHVSRSDDGAKAKVSRSILADVLSTNKQPQTPPTPRPMLTGSNAPWTANSSSTAPLAATAAAAARVETSHPSSSPSSSSSRRTAHGHRPIAHDRSHASGHLHGTRDKVRDWGLFSNRKSEILHNFPTFKRHDSGTSPSGGTGKARQASRDRHHHREQRSHALDRADAANGPPQTTDPARQDFWGELETRATGLKDRFKTKAAFAQPILSHGQGQGQGQGQAQETDDADINDALQSVSRARKSGTESQPSKQRRASRFDVEEGAEFDDRRAKDPKSAKSPNQKNRRVSEVHDWDNDGEAAAATARWEKKQRRKAEREALQRQQEQEQEEPQATPIFLPEYISASNLSKALKQKADQFLRDMEEMGFENITADTIFTGETAALIAMEYGFEPTVDSGSQRDLRPRPAPEDASLLPPRPPVVTIMGHVDHGKTTLLDWLRKSSVAAQEHGGITQHIGAFVVKMSSGKAITFLDTPGHAAFLSMRQRGANVTDIVVLVVAADDSVKPQTLEALKHATAAKVPIIVAINKIDKEDAKVEQVKSDLSRHGVEIEDFGGDVQVVCVSGKTGQGMGDLEENIVTLSEVLDVRAEDDGMAEGWILESSIKTQGRTATVLVKRGTLRPGDLLVAGQTWARIRTLRDEGGQELASAPPGTPVEILGWRELPDAGQQVLQAPDEKRAKTAVEYRLEMAEREQSSLQLAEQEQRQREKAAAAEQEAAAAAAAATSSSTTTDPTSTHSSGPPDPGILFQNFTVKADVAGSVEAVCGTILELGNHEVRPRILRSSAGPLSESDVDHAAASASVLVNFNLPIAPHIKQRAEEAGVRILDRRVIYHVVDDARDALSRLLPEAVSYRVTGEADVVQVFAVNVKRRTYQNIAGCRVRNGSIKRAASVKVLRRGKVVFEGKIDTLKHVKKDVQEMGKNTECGIGLDGFDDFQADDQIQTFEEIKEKRYL